METECAPLGLFVTLAVNVLASRAMLLDHQEKVVTYLISCKPRGTFLSHQYLKQKLDVSQMKSWLISISYIKPSGLRGVTVGMTLKQPR
jgi:hypothetical protein